MRSRRQPWHRGPAGLSTRRRRRPSVSQRERLATRTPRIVGISILIMSGPSTRPSKSPWRMAAGVDVVDVNPSSVQGPGRSTGTGKILLDLVAGRLSTVVDTRISIVDIDDCARGDVLAAAGGVSKQRYVLNSFSMTIQEAVGLSGR